MKSRVDRARAELADFVLRLCCAAGLLAGMLAGLQAGPGEPKAREPGKEAVVGPGLWEAVEPMVWPTVGGALTGVAVGFVLALAIRPRR